MFLLEKKTDKQMRIFIDDSNEKSVDNRHRYKLFPIYVGLTSGTYTSLHINKIRIRRFLESQHRS